MNMIFMLGWIWWAILGLAAVLVGFWFLGGKISERQGGEPEPMWLCLLVAAMLIGFACALFNDGHTFWGVVVLVIMVWGFWAERFPNPKAGQKYRDRWLLEHFGVEGRLNWLENERRIEDAKKRHLWHERVRMYGWPHRTSDGKCEGIVVSCLYGMETGQSAPWGSDFYPYPVKHQKDPYWTYGDATGLNGSIRFHGEPNGSDWLAAGFWDPVMCHGVLVNPIEALIQQIRREVGKYGCTASCPLEAGSEVSKMVMAEANRRVDAEEKRTGVKSGKGRHPNMI